MKKLLSTALFLCLGLAGFAQEWYEYPQKIESVNAINEQSIAIDEDNGYKYSFYLDGNNLAILKKYNPVSQEWDEVTNSFNLIGTSSPAYLTVMAKSGEVVIGFYDQSSQNYFIFYDIGGGFFQVGTPIYCADGLNHAKMVYNGTFNKSYLLRYVTGDGEDIQIDYIDVPGASIEDYGLLPIPGGPSSQPSKPDIFVSDTDIWVIHEYFSSGAGNDECLIQKCPIGSPNSWTTHAGIGLNLDNFTIYGDPTDFPYFAYEDIDNTLIRLNKVSGTGYDNISQFPISPSGIENLRLARSNADDVFIAYKDAQDNKIRVLKNDGGGGFVSHGTGSYADYFDVNAIDLLFFDPFNTLNVAFGVPPGPGQGAYFAHTNDLPSYAATTKSHCNNTNASDTLLLFTTTDINKDSVYIISATSSDQGVIADAQLSIANVAHAFGQSIRKTLVYVNNVGNAGTTNITVTYTDGIDTTSNNVSYTVNADPSIFLSIPTMDTCVNTASFDLNNYVTPTGGVWTGGNIFDPASQGVGTHNIDYNYTDGNGCSATVTQVINVNGLPSITFTTDPLNLCEDAATEDLLVYASPSGGNFVEGNNFDPASEGVGSFTRTYQYTDGNGCTNSNTMSVEVLALPSISFSSDPIDLCEDAPSEDLLSYASPSGGFYTEGNSFDPAVEGVGTFTRTYEYTDGNGCYNNSTLNVTVHQLPAISFSADPVELCENESVVDLLTYASPTGGFYTEGDNFDPSIEGLGGHTRTYEYTDANGCYNSELLNINVNAAPIISFSLNPLDICEGEPSQDLTAYASPSGGNFVEGNNFDPTSEGIGSHTRTYQYTDGNGCSSSSILNIDVHQLPMVTLLNTPVEVCVNDDLVDLTPFVQESDGTFSPNDSFDPGTYGVGTHVITYTRTDAYGCMNSENFNVVVNDLPVVNFNSSSIQLCSNGDVYDMNQNIAGGLPGVFTNTNGNFFDPVQYPEGSINNIFYKITNSTTGCSNESSFEIELLEIPVLTSSTTPSNCGANDGSVDLTVSAANGPTSIYWSNGSLTEDLTNLAPGVYYANVTDNNNCVAVLPVDIQSNEINLAVNITDVTCFGGNDGSIDLTPSGNGPFLFLWATADSTEDVSNLSAGTYFVTVTDDNGCVTTANYSVGQPEKLDFESIVTPSNCPANDGSISITSEIGGDGNYNYNWIGTTGGNMVGSLANGAYTFWLTDGNGCSSDTAHYNVSGSTAPELFATVTNSDCNMNNGAIDLIIGGNPSHISSINWSNTASTEDISNLSPGNYTVTVENNSGCTSTLTKSVGIVKPSQNDLCVVTVDSATTTNLVVWERVQTTGIDHYNIYRENAIAGEYIKIDEVHADSLSQYVDLAASPEVRSWRYKLSATNECGIEGPQSLHHKTIHIVYSDNGSGGYNISWDQYEGFTYGTYFIDRRDAVNTNWVEVGQVTVGNSLTLTDNPPTIVGLDYRVSVETPGQCTATKANDYNSSRSNRSAGIFAPGDTDIPDVGLTELNLSYEVDVYPNPSSGILNIMTDDQAPINTIEIQAINGTIVLNENVTGNFVTTDVSRLENGIYFIIVHTNEGKSLHKFIKQ